MPNLRVTGCICDTVDELYLFRDSDRLETLLTRIRNICLTPNIKPLQLLFRTTHKLYMDLANDNGNVMVLALVFISQLNQILGSEILMNAIWAADHRGGIDVRVLLEDNFVPKSYWKMNERQRDEAMIQIVLNMGSEYGTHSEHVGMLEDKPIFITPKHSMGLTTPGSLPGDLICVLTGCNFPVLLRRNGSTFQHIGPCFVYGLMEDEAAEMVQKGETVLQEFLIQ